MKSHIRYTSLLIGALLLAACANPAATLAPATAAPATAVSATRAPLMMPTDAVAATAAPTAAPAPDKGLLFARPQGLAGPLVAYDVSTGSARFSLPAGRLSADGGHFFGTAQAGADTLFSGYDLSTGQAAVQARVPGQWALGAVSSDGGWAALARVYPDAQTKQWTDGTWKSEIRILDGKSGKTAQALSLDGNFEVDGLSRSGDSLYLIQYVPADKPTHYVVRLYDRTTKSLAYGALVEKRATDEVMVGDRWTAVGSPDGEWLLTLYLRTKDGTAFIHALNLANRYAWCIDLPGKTGNLDQLKYYTLALAPDGKNVFAANAALGTVAQANLDDLSVVTAVKFDPTSPALAWSQLPQSLSAVAPGGRMMYFTNGMQAWAFDGQKGAVRPLGTAGPITGLGVSADGARVYVARAGQALVTMEAGGS
jgi:hypothetical protein